MRLKQAQASGKTVLRKKNVFSRMLAQWDLQILLVPGILLVLLFSYVPMYGVVMGFQDFKLGDFPGFSQWVGFKHFQTMFADKYFGLAMRNTLVISALKMFIGFPLPIFFAVLLNEMNFQPLKKTVQTVSYLPHFISWVVCATLMFDLMSTDGGAINEFLMWIGVIKEPIGFFTEGKYFWGITLCTDIWKELGWNAIIFISAITSISQDMYEAADIDGATRAQKMWHITNKSNKPTIILMFIFQVGGILNANFDQIMMLTKQMGNSMLKEYADVLDTFIYRLGVSQGRFSFAAAAGLFKSIVNFALLLGSNYVAGKFGEAQLF